MRVKVRVRVRIGIMVRVRVGATVRVGGRVKRLLLGGLGGRRREVHRLLHVPLDGGERVRHARLRVDAHVRHARDHVPEQLLHLRLPLLFRDLELALVEHLG